MPKANNMRQDIRSSKPLTATMTIKRDSPKKKDKAKETDSWNTNCGTFFLPRESVKMHINSKKWRISGGEEIRRHDQNAGWRTYWLKREIDNEPELQITSTSAPKLMWTNRTWKSSTIISTSSNRIDIVHRALCFPTAQLTTHKELLSMIRQDATAPQPQKMPSFQLVVVSKFSLYAPTGGDHLGAKCLGYDGLLIIYHSPPTSIQNSRFQKFCQNHIKSLSVA